MEIIIRNIYYIILLLSGGVAFFLLKKVKKATLFLCLYIIYNLLNEGLADASVIWFGNNYVTHNIYIYISLVLICLYYYYLNYSSSKITLPLILLFLGILLGIGNNIFLQSILKSHNYNFLFLANLIVIILSLYTIYKMILAPQFDKIIYRMFHFWVACIFAFYSLLNLLARSMFYPFQIIQDNNNLFYIIILLSNIFLYLSLSILLLISFKKA